MERSNPIAEELKFEPDLQSKTEDGTNLPVPPPEIFMNQRDTYNTRYIGTNDLPVDHQEFRRRLEITLSHFKQEKVKGVYLELTIDQFALLGIAKEFGFTLHHAEGNLMTLQKWVPDTPSKLPPYSSHYVGVGGLVIDWKTCKVLVIQERSGNDVFTWKIPGGLVDTGEYASEAAIREVREETGILTNFKGVVAIREKRKYNFGRNDIYFVCLLEPSTTEINIDEVEIAECKWVDVDEWAKHEFKIGTQQLICRIAQEIIHKYKENQAEGNHLSNVWLPTEVEIDLRTPKGKHLAYVPEYYAKNSSSNS